MPIKRRANMERWIALPPGAVNDNRLSWKARGLLIYLLSKPDDWEVRVQQLIDSSPDGKAVVQAIFRELKKYGYASLAPLTKAGTTKLSGNRWLISDAPVTDNTENTVSHQTGKPSDGKTVGRKTASITYSGSLPSLESSPTLDTPQTPRKRGADDLSDLGTEDPDDTAVTQGVKDGVRQGLRKKQYRGHKGHTIAHYPAGPYCKDCGQGV